MSTLQWNFAYLYARMGDGQIADVTAGQTTIFKRAINDGYLRVLNDHSWSFLRQQARLSIDSAPVLGTVDVWVTSDVAGATVVAYGETNASTGIVTFDLDDGTYYLWAQKSGYDQTGPAEKVVNGTTAWTSTLYLATSPSTTVHDEITAGGANTVTYTSVDGDSIGIDDLPANFAYITDDPVIATDAYERVLERRTPEELEHIRTTSELVSSDPRIYAIRQKSFSSTTGARYEIMLWPPPSIDLTLSIAYKIETEEMTADAEYPLGGPSFAPIILAAAKAEQEMDNNKTEGHAAGRYARMLAQGIERDKQNQPAVIRSDMIRRGTYTPEWTYTTGYNV